MAVANSLSNDILLYQYDPSAGPAGQFNLVTRYNVGDDPVSITVADINGDKVPDLAVANQGSNDVSILIGAIDKRRACGARPRISASAPGAAAR